MAFAPILMGVSAAFSAIGALASGNAQAASANYNAKVDDNNAEQAQIGGMMQASAARSRGRMAEGEAAQVIGQSGVQSGTGTALETLRESSINSEFDQLAARYTAQSQSNAYTSDAAGQRMAGSADRTAGIFRAGSALLQGASGVAKMGGFGGGGGGGVGSGGGGLSMPTPQLGYDTTGF